MFNIGLLVGVPMVIVPSAFKPFPPVPELVVVTVPPLIVIFVSDENAADAYESVVPAAFVYNAPFPALITVMFPAFTIISPSADNPFAPFAAAVAWIVVVPLFAMILPPVFTPVG